MHYFPAIRSSGHFRAALLERLGALERFRSPALCSHPMFCHAAVPSCTYAIVDNRHWQRSPNGLRTIVDRDGRNALAFLVFPASCLTVDYYDVANS